MQRSLHHLNALQEEKKQINWSTEQNVLCRQKEQAKRELEENLSR